jgi:hypothetical protein
LVAAHRCLDRKIPNDRAPQCRRHLDSREQLV